jgi:hypothetical protein
MFKGLVLESRTFPELNVPRCGMKIVRAIALVALGFLAVTAIWGAAFLILVPSGSPMKIPLTVLQHTWFHSFLIPGILLLVSNGLLGTVVFAIAAFCKRGYGKWIAFQGCVLFGWITIEVILLREIVWLHYVYWGLALILIATGWALDGTERRVQARSRSSVAALQR